MSCEIPSRLGSVLVQKSGRVDHDMRITALDAFYGKDGRRSRYIGEVVERFRGEDAGDLKRIDLVENWLRNGYVSMLSRGKFGKLIRRF